MGRRQWQGPLKSEPGSHSYVKSPLHADFAVKCTPVPEHTDVFSASILTLGCNLSIIIPVFITSQPLASVIITL